MQTRYDYFTKMTRACFSEINDHRQKNKIKIPLADHLSFMPLNRGKRYFLTKKSLLRKIK